MISTQQKVIRNKVGLLRLAEELRNVSRACQVMGYSRDTFYRYKAGGRRRRIRGAGGSPQTNGICERFHRTVLEEFYQVTFRKKIYGSLEELQTDLGVKRSHSRPRVSNDDPFSESNFHTLKSRPDYPERFGSYEDAASFCRRTFNWYNHEHHHSGIAMLTPAQVHYGHAEEVLSERQRVLDAAYAVHPERFVHGSPQVPSLPQAVWINPPEDKNRSEIKLH